MRTRRFPTDELRGLADRLAQPWFIRAAAEGNQRNGIAALIRPAAGARRAASFPRRRS